MSEAAVPGGMRSRVGAAKLLSDDRLVRRAVQGDERAFAAIFDRYHQALYRFCLAILVSPPDAQDALQNTMVKVLGALPGEERPIDLKPWLYRIAHNESVELLRRRRPTEELDPELVSGGRGLAEDAESRERLRRLLSDLELLPERQRGTLVMRELAGLDFEEIGAAMGTSPAVARQTLYEARQSLRQMDGGREMDCDAVTAALSDADGRVTRRRDIRAHLRACPDCRRFQEEIAGRREDLGALAPLPGVAAAGLLQGLLGGAASGGSGAGLAGAAAGGAAKSLGTGAAVKSAAAVVAVAAVGVGAADRGGVDVTPWGGGGSQQQQQQQRSQGERTGGPALAPAAASTTPKPDAERGPATANPTVGLDADADAAQNAKGEASGDAGAAPPATPAQAGRQPSVAAPGRGPSDSHPSGRGHEKQHPDAASHGQQTAAGNKAGGKGVGQGRGGGADKAAPAKQPKSTKPAKAPKPATTPPKPTTKPPKPEKPTQASQQAPSGSEANAAPKAPSDPGAAAPPHPSPSPQAGEPKGKGPPH